MKPLDTHSNPLPFNHLIGVIRIRKADLKIIMANAKACEILGEDNITEKSLDQYFQEKNSIAALHTLIGDESVTDHDLSVVRKDGKVRWVGISHSLYRGEEYAEILLYDNTVSRLKTDALERRNLLLDQFIATVSHDLRGPIGNLLGLLDLSKKETESVQTLHTYADMMIQRVQYLDGILKDLTSIALNDKTAPEVDCFNVEEEINAILSNHQETKKQVHVTLDLKQYEHFYTDTRRLRIILRNLISNAIKYQKPTSKYPYIRITIVVNHDRATIEIADNGVGIAPKHEEKIYSMFYRGTDASAGTGLGLYIVKSMLDKLQGTIAHKSSPEGTIFRIEIPIPEKKPDSSGQDYVSLYASTWLRPGDTF